MKKGSIFPKLVRLIESLTDEEIQFYRCVLHEVSVTQSKKRYNFYVNTVFIGSEQYQMNLFVGTVFETETDLDRAIAEHNRLSSIVNFDFFKEPALSHVFRSNFKEI